MNAPAVSQKNEIINAVSAPDVARELKKALPAGVDVERYVRGFRTYVLNLAPDDKIFQCAPASVIKTILTAAQLGLDIDAKGHAFPIPFFNKKKNQLDLQLVPGYKGYIAKARQSSMVSGIWAEAVYTGDAFRVVKGTAPKIEHYPDVDGKSYGDDKKISHFYAVVKLASGEVEFEVMTRAQVDEIKKDTDIWRKNYGEMGRKTVMRRILKRLQLPETAELSQTEEAADAAMEDAQGTMEKAEIDVGYIKTRVRKALKILKWDAKQFQAYLSGKGIQSWDSLLPVKQAEIAAALEDRGQNLSAKDATIEDPKNGGDKK